MITRITKPTQEQYIKAIKSMNFDEVDRLEEIGTQETKEVMAAIASGEIQGIFYDMPPVKRPGVTSFLRYILHRSSRKDGFLQFTCLEIRNGQEIPTSHTDIDCKDGGEELYHRFPENNELHYI